MINKEEFRAHLVQQGLTEQDINFCVDAYCNYNMEFKPELFMLDRKVDYRDFVNELIQDKMGDNEIISDYLADPHVADDFVKFYIRRWAENLVYNDVTRTVIVFKNCI